MEESKMDNRNSTVMRSAIYQIVALDFERL